MEIDEYRDYEKALNALKKAGEYMTKARGGDSREEKVQALRMRIMHIEQVSAGSSSIILLFIVVVVVVLLPPSMPPLTLNHQ